MDEIGALKAELEHYRQEKEKIRDVIGQVGGASSKKRDLTINAIFLVAVLGLFLLDISHYFWEPQWALPPFLGLEIALLLVSVKIVWMIHKQTKVDHFQFWILNSIEFQMNMITRRLTSLEEAVKAGRRTIPVPPSTYPDEDEDA